MRYIDPIVYQLYIGVLTKNSTELELQKHFLRELLPLGLRYFDRWLSKSRKNDNFMIFGKKVFVHDFLTGDFHRYLSGCLNSFVSGEETQLSICTGRRVPTAFYKAVSTPFSDNYLFLHENQFNRECEKQRFRAMADITSISDPALQISVPEPLIRGNTEWLLNCAFCSRPYLRMFIPDPKYITQKNIEHYEHLVKITIPRFLMESPGEVSEFVALGKKVMLEVCEQYEQSIGFLTKNSYLAGPAINFRWEGQYDIAGELYMLLDYGPFFNWPTWAMCLSAEQAKRMSESMDGWEDLFFHHQSLANGKRYVQLTEEIDNIPAAPHKRLTETFLPFMRPGIQLGFWWSDLSPRLFLKEENLFFSPYGRPFVKLT